MSKIYPVGIQSFEKIREGGYCYIDKTSLIYSLVKSGQYYFLSRPRRFGKSLLISTLEAYFLGRKELFKGLAMEGLEKDWTVHPVLHLDLNTQRYDTPEALTNVLEENLSYWESLYGASESEIGVARRFNGIIRRAAEKTGRKVVVLVDEYDKPMLQAIGNEPLLTDYRNTLKAFYGALKSNDNYLRFALLTGVTKFSKVSVFSDLNNLMDISIDDRFASICGITEHELHTDFKEDILTLARKNRMTEDEAKQQLKEQYDGYHFVEDSEDIYNPFSLLNTFAKMKFGSYWFETGTPTFLVELLQRSKYDLHRLTEEMATADSLGGIDTMETNPVPILYQSGYLTIKGFDKEFRTYELGFPNKEVEEGFTKFLLPNYASLTSGNPSFEIISATQLCVSHFGQPFFRDKQLRQGSTQRQHRCLYAPPPELLCRHALRVGARLGTALPERALHCLQAAGFLHSGRIPYIQRPHRHGAEDRPLHLRHGVQAEWQCRRSHPPNQ